MRNRPSRVRLRYCKSSRRRFFEKPPERFRGDAFRPARTRRLLLQDIAGSDQEFESRSVFAGEAFDNGIRGLPLARIEDLDLSRVGTRIGSSSLSIENYGDACSGPILILPQFFDERVARQGAATSMKGA